ncbi:regulator of G-protein signaling 4-like isoform X2 [Lytechinus variegatus]|uniref:regulator of G-protein signaling 4-like isoform X2 n=1 Tax=Lytechinus variegatus TaxID=7654 RepID=UPI001BB2B913|nr:regulator of G-protein signaling 4-like isoform X2 [Lytechinus variegatus]
MIFRLDMHFGLPSARDLKDKMRFLRRRHTDSSLRDTNKFNCEKISLLEVEDVRKWGESFENLLRDKNGLEAFRKFLQTEFSDENIEFWLACEDYKKLKSSKLSSRARKIYDDYVTIQAPREASFNAEGG